jgi:dehydrogenase/reductase SDR family protein 12
MIDLHETIRVDRSVRDCFRYLADFSTCEQWDPGVYRARKLTAGAPAPGTAFRVILAGRGENNTLTYRLTDMTPPESLVFEGEAAGFSVRDEIHIRPLPGDRAEIDYRARIDFHGRLGSLAGLGKPLLKRMGRRAMAGLKRALTLTDTPPAPSLTGWLGHRAVLPAAWQFTERGYLAMPDKGLTAYMDNKTVAITGPTSGLGLAAACELARLGANLLLIGRNQSRLQEAVREIVAFSGCPAEKVRVYQAELSSLAAAREVAATIRREAPALDGLINNAGALFADRQETDEGHERVLAINLLTPWVLTRELLPALQTASGRVINVASGGLYTQPLRLDDMQYRKEGYNGSKAYARAKRALVSATAYLASQHPSGNVTFHSMHPGWAATPGVARSLPGFNKARKQWLRDARMGADTMVWLASHPAPARTSGRFWFDRKPRPTAVLPGTRVDARQQQQLIDWLDRVTGFTETQ